MKDPNMNKPGYKKTTVGWIPSTWRVDTVGNVCKIRNELRLPISVDVRKSMPGEYPYYGPTGILDHIHGYRVEGMYALIGEDGDHFLKYSTRPMTMLVSGRFNVNNHAHLIQGNKHCGTEWFYLYFLHRNIFTHLTRQGAGRYKLNKEEVSKLLIAFPSLTEQKKIAEILSTWDEAIEQTRKLIDAKKRRKKALMQQLLTGKKRLPGFVKSSRRIQYRFFDLPEDWECPPIGKIGHECTERNGHGEKMTVLSCSKHVGFVESAQYFGKQVFSEDTSNYKVIRKGWFGYPSNHIEEGSIGLLTTHDLGIVSPIYTVFRTNAEMCPEYLYSLFKTEMYRQIFAKSTNASVDRRGSLRWHEFSRIQVPLPSLEEQRRIAEVISTADNEIKTIEQKVSALEKQKRGLMHKLLTGEVRVNAGGY